MRQISTLRPILPYHFSASHLKFKHWGTANAQAEQCFLRVQGIIGRNDASPSPPPSKHTHKEELKRTSAAESIVPNSFHWKLTRAILFRHVENRSDMAPMPAPDISDEKRAIIVNIDDSAVPTYDPEPFLRHMKAAAIYTGGGGGGGGRQVGTCEAKLIMREALSSPDNFIYAMEETAELEDFAKDTDIFKSDGTMQQTALCQLFNAHDFFAPDQYRGRAAAPARTPARVAPSSEDSPGNRAWIVYFEIICVDENSRRAGIGTLLVESLLAYVLEKATIMERPLLAATRPGYLSINHASVDDVTQGVKQNEDVSIQFWTALKFTRLTKNAIGTKSELFFWGVSTGLQNSKSLAEFTTACTRSGG